MGRRSCPIPHFRNPFREVPRINTKTYRMPKENIMQTEKNTYDAIVVGSRCAGSPTAMLLARQGHRVLLVDRARFPSDKPMSTHYIMRPGGAALGRWGLLERLAKLGA